MWSVESCATAIMPTEREASNFRWTTPVKFALKEEEQVVKVRTVPINLYRFLCQWGPCKILGGSSPLKLPVYRHP